MDKADFPKRKVRYLLNIRERILGLLIIIASIAGFYGTSGVTPYLFVVSGLLGIVLTINALKNDENYYQ